MGLINNGMLVPGKWHQDYVNHKITILFLEYPVFAEGCAVWFNCIIFV